VKRAVYTDPFGPAAVGDDLYDAKCCRLCGRYCPDGAARDNHARKHEREGAVAITGFGGPDGARRFRIIDPFAVKRRRDIGHSSIE
jgi:hypothetical protein